jgi:alpha-1,4-digalacturonate transport system permease protein
MFVPVAWLVLSSFKTEGALLEFPPTLLPYGRRPSRSGPIAGAAGVRRATGRRVVAEMVELRRIGLVATMLPIGADPPMTRRSCACRSIAASRSANSASRRRTTPSSCGKFDFVRYCGTRVFITVVATLITLLFNAMAAFALAKYRFRGRHTVFLVILATLMVPPTIVLVPELPRRLAARLSEQPVGRDLAGGRDADRRVPASPVHADHSRRAHRRGAHGPRERVADLLAHRPPAFRPALAVLAIFSVMWRWNDFLWPLVVLSGPRSSRCSSR